MNDPVSIPSEETRDLIESAIDKSKQESIDARSVVEWLRSQSMRFAQMADDLEGLGGGTSVAPELSERILNLIQAQSKRPREIALKLGVSKRLVKASIARHTDLFSKNARGWIRGKS